MDGLGNTLKTEKVENGKSAKAPAAPIRDGYTFKSWDKNFSKVTGDMTVTALWEKNAEPAPAPEPAPTPEKKASGTLLAKLTAKGRQVLYHKSKGE